MELNCTSTYQNKATCIQPTPFQEHQLYFYFAYLWWMEGVGSVTIGLLGIIFNFTTISVVLGSELSAYFFNWLLVCLAMLDNFHLLNGILEAFRNHFGFSQLNYTFVYFLHYFRSVILCCLEYMKILLALERYHALSSTEEFNRRNSSYKATGNLNTYFLMYWARLIKYVSPIIAFTSLWYLPKFMEVEFMEEKICSMAINNSSNLYSNCSCMQRLVVHETDFRKNDLYILWYLNVGNVVATVLIPLTSLLYLYFNILIKLKRHVEIYSSIGWKQNNHGGVIQEKRREKKQLIMVEQTKMLFAVVIFFLISHTPRSILNLEELGAMKNVKMARNEGCVWMQYWTAILVPVSHILLQVNSSITLFIYCFFNSLFRETLKRKLMRMVGFDKRENNVSESDHFTKNGFGDGLSNENMQERCELLECTKEIKVIAVNE